MRISKKLIFVTNLFCEGPWSAKFILRLIFVTNLFCEGLWSAKFILRRPFGVQNLFCEGEVYFTQSGNAI